MACYILGPAICIIDVAPALHDALTLAGLTILSSLSFHALRAGDGESISRGRLREVGKQRTRSARIGA